MTTLKIENFTGMIPRTPDDRLPNGAAKTCTNCDFRYGELRPLGSLGATFPTSVSPVRGMFSDDGDRFFVWDKITRAYLAPTIDDSFERVYYQHSGGTGLRVAQRSNMRSKTDTPGSPTESWLVGVPRPAWAPKAYRVPSFGWNGNTDILVRIIAYWFVAGAKVSQSQPLTITSVPYPWYRYHVNPADIGDLNPSSAGSEVVAGWVYGDATIIAISTNGTSVTRAAGEWRTDSSGLIEIRYANQFQQMETTFSSFVQDGLDGTGAAYPIQYISYRGKSWSQGSTALFNELTKDKVRGPTPADGYLGFELEVVDTSDDTVIYRARAELMDTTPAGEYVIEPFWPDSLKETVSYVTTFENLAREESAPSDPTLIDVYPFTDVHFYQPTETVSLEDSIPLVGMNVYRTYAGNNAAYILVNEHPIDWQVTWEGMPSWFIWDDTKTPATATTLESAEWENPPIDMHNLTYVGNGFFAGGHNKDVLFSEPYRGHTWPYRMSLPHQVVGITPVEGGILVTTTDLPYLILGADPASMSQQVIQVSQAGISSHSIARIGNAAIYLSNDGIVSLSGGQPSIKASQQLFTRQDWRNRYGSALHYIHAAEHDDILFCVVPHPNQTETAQPFALRMDAESSHMTNLALGTIYSAQRVGTTDALFFGLSNGIAEFWPSGVAAASMTWHSGDFRFPRPVCFGAGKVVCDGVLTLEIYNGTTLVATQECDGMTFFRLPPVAPQELWSFRVTGTGSLRFMEFGSSYAAIKEV